MSKELIVFGSGEIAEVVAFYFEHDAGRKVSGFVVDDDFLERNLFCDKPIVGTSSVASIFNPETHDAFVAIGYSGLNFLRESKCNELGKLGYSLTSFVSKDACIAPNVQYGSNCLILEHNTVQPFSVVGDNTFLWSGNHVGHHAQVGRNVFISSHCVISGGVSIGNNSFLGVNSTLSDHITIGREVVIGAGSLVLGDVADGGVVLGQRSRISPISSRSLPNF